MMSLVMYLPFVIWIGSLVVAVVFLMAAWRGMIAHESIAESLKGLVKQNKIQ